MQPASHPETSDRWGEAQGRDRLRDRQRPQAARPSRPWTAITLVVTFVASGLFAAGLNYGRGQQAHPQRVLPGEFEQQDALLVSWPTGTFDGAEVLRELVVDIVRAAHLQVEMMVLMSHDGKEDEIAEQLRAAGVDTDRLSFLRVAAETPWVRDYGPLAAKSYSGGIEILDSIYTGAPQFPHQDHVPSTIGAALGLPLVEVGLAMENGNLLSNGAGLCITTNKLLVANPKKSRPAIAKLLREKFGASQVVFLEPLQGEPNQHVDMFSTFTAPDAVVVGQYQRSQDPINAAILDRNAERLAQIRTACGPLQVHRIPMPDRVNKKWCTFTNVVYANGTLLVPSYGARHATSENQAIAMYGKLLPSWQIVSIDCAQAIDFTGALHCATANLMTNGKRRPLTLSSP